MTMNNLMVDLETASTSTQAAIISIGAVWFDFEQRALGATYYQSIDLSSAIEAGFEVGGDAICWWMQQSENTREVFNDPNRVGLVEGLQGFSDFIRNHEHSPKVWGNGPAFDNAILHTAYRRLNLEKPWHYTHDRCFRTLLDVAKASGFEPTAFQEGIAHNALDDAVYQAKTLIEAMVYLQSWAIKY